MTNERVDRPPFWGLTLSFDPDAHVLVIEDHPEDRQHILERLFRGCHLVWASNLDEVRAALDLHGPFDAYSLDFDLGEERGGWLESGRLIREHDPVSIAKIVLVHSANTDAREYFTVFPAAIFIQWDVLATILGETIVDRNFVEAVLSEAGAQASPDKLRDATLKLRSEK